MSTGPVNHYATLKLERGADDAAIKRAYFTLIRQFPPETHAEEFQKLREAYETLRDPEKRKAYDESTNFTAYGDDTGGQLTVAQHAIDSEEWPRAIALLQPLVEERPELHVAFDMLAMAYLQTEKVPDARAAMNKALALRQDVGKYHFHMGLILHAAGNRHAAVDELWKAVELEPQNAPAHRALVNFAQELEQIDVCVKALDHALEHAAENIFEIFEITLRKAFFQWKEVGPKAVLATVDGLVAKVPADADEETRKFLAIRLSRMAATSFAENAVNLGNAILQRCQALRPGAKASAPFPRMIDTDVRALPSEQQAFLRRALEEGELATVPKKLRWSTLGKSAGLSAAAVAIVAFALSPRGPWMGLELVLLPALVIAGMLGLAHGLWLIWSHLTSEFDEFRFVHGVFYFHLRQNRLRAWPLFTLENLRFADHHENQVYKYTTLFARFGGDVHPVRFPSRLTAQQWAHALDAKRLSALDMLATGLLEEDPAALFFPPEMLEAARKKKSRLGKAPQPIAWYASGAAAGLAIALGAMHLSAGQEGEAEFVSAWHGSVPAQSELLERSHATVFTERLKAERDRRLKEARRRCDARLLPTMKVNLCQLVPLPDTSHSVTVTGHVAGDAKLDAAAAPLWASVIRETLWQLTGDDVVSVGAHESGGSNVDVDCSTRPTSSAGSSAGQSLECRISLTGPQITGESSTSVSASSVGPLDDLQRRDLERAVVSASLLDLGVAPEGQRALAAIAEPVLKTSPYAGAR